MEENKYTDIIPEENNSFENVEEVDAELHAVLEQRLQDHVTGAVGGVARGRVDRENVSVARDWGNILADGALRSFCHNNFISFLVEELVKTFIVMWVLEPIIYNLSRENWAARSLE